MILDQMQVLDEEIAPTRTVGQKRHHLVARARIDLATLRRARRPAPPGSPAILGR